MVMPVAPRGLVARDAVAHVDALHQPQLRERVERAVDARDPDGAACGVERVVELLRAGAARLSREHVQHGRAGATRTQPRVAEHAVRRLEPDTHGATIAVLICMLGCRRVRTVLISVLAAAVLGGCGGGAGNGGTRVVAAFYPLAFAAERVAGD